MTVRSPSTSGKIQKNLPLRYDFNIDGVFSEAWQKVHGAKATYWSAVLITIIINVVITSVFAILAVILFGSSNGSGFQNPNFQHYFSMISNIVSLILTPLLIGIYYLGIRRVSEEPIKSSMIFAPFKRFLPIIGTILLTYFFTAIIILIGLFISGILGASAQTHGFPILSYLATIIGIFTFFAAFYICFGLTFAPILVFEKRMGIWTAIKASLLGFSQHWFKILMTSLAFFVLLILSAIPIFIGLIWTVPMGINLYGILYRIIFGVEK
jgi:hypothetical protein